MATIVHRRLVRVAVSEPRGPGASLSALTWVGWLSVVAAAVSFAVAIAPVFDMGDVRGWDWATVLGIAWSGVRGAALLALPAALEWGVPGARHRTPWLMRGAVLLALEVIASQAISVANRAWMESVVFEDISTSPMWLAARILQLGAAVIGIAGAWAISDGLADAGARIDRRLLAAAALAGALLSASYLPFYLVTEDLGDVVSFVGGPLGLLVMFVGVALAALDGALWMVVAIRLVVGPRLGLHPRRAWLIGAVAGVTVIVSAVIAAALPFARFPDWALLWTMATGLAQVPWILLAGAFAAGLGRGRERRDDRPRPVHRHELRPAA